MSSYKDSLSLIKSVGLPGIIEGKASLSSKRLNLFHLSKLNKIPLLYLESQGAKGLSSLDLELSRYRKKYEETLNLTKKVSDVFEKSGIHYTLFKTLKPFPNTPSDIDVLLWSNNDLKKAYSVLKDNGFRALDKDQYGITMYNVEHSLNVDLTTEVAVSGFIYLDKILLFDNTTQVKINDFTVQTLSLSADLAMIAAHCMYKEQMYLLSDYYAIVLSSHYVKEALPFARNANVYFALEIALQITYDITIRAFGSNNAIAKELDSCLSSNFKLSNAKESFGLPEKYPLHIMLRGLLEKFLEDQTSRSSLSAGFRATFRPRAIHRLFSHVSRKSY